MPAKPRWLLSIPDAISQLENLDRTLLTRRDIERLFGVSKARAATLMQTFGAEMTGNQRTLPRTKLLQQLKKHRGRAAFRGEEERRARLVTELRKARITGIRVPLPAETLNSKLASLPEGVTVERDRIEVRFSGAKNATERLYAPGFRARERLRAVRGARRSRRRWWGRGGEEMTTEALVPAAGEPSVATGGAGEIVLPRVIVDAGPEATARFLEFFAGRIAKREDAGGVRAGRRAIPGVVRGARPRAARRLPAPRGRLHPDAPRVGPHGEAAPGRDPHARRLARRQPGPPGEPCGRGAGDRRKSSPRARRRSSRRRRRGSSSRRSTRAPWPGSGTGRCSPSCSTASRG